MRVMRRVRQVMLWVMTRMPMSMRLLLVRALRVVRVGMEIRGETLQILRLLRMPPVLLAPQLRLLLHAQLLRVVLLLELLLRVMRRMMQRRARRRRGRVR